MERKRNNLQGSIHNLMNAFTYPENSVRKYGLLWLFLVAMSVFNLSRACSPLSTPNYSFTAINGVLTLTVTNTTVWLAPCSNLIEVEVACNTSGFNTIITGTSAAASFTSQPYTYPTFTVNIANLCAGSVYKLRVRERWATGGTFSSWSSTQTFTTSGTYLQPTLNLLSIPNIICPPAQNQLFATLTNTCGNSTFNYSWTPSTGLSATNVANPVATVTAPITYTCYVDGGQLGCWTVSNTIQLNMGTSPPIGGTAVASPSAICYGKTVTLSVSGFSGSIQWQSSSSSSGPWTNVPNGNGPTLVTAPIFSPTCYQVLVGACSGTTTATSNVVCVNANLSPVLIPTTGCSGTSLTVTYSITNAASTATNVVWSPAPASINSNSTFASYLSPITSNFTVSFADGCVSSGSIAIPPPGLSFVTSAVTCSSLGTATVSPVNMINGPYVYYWSPSAQTNSNATGIHPGTYTVNAGYNGGNCAYSTTVSFVSSVQYYGTVNNTSILDCYAVNNGTASISIFGGTGNNNYLWTDGVNSQTTALATNLAAGVYTVYIYDGITSCATNQIFIILQPSPITLTVSAVSPTACAGSTASLTAQASGGTPGSGYTYNWTAGPTASNYIATQATAGAHIYTVVAMDSNNCPVTGNYQITYVANPVITLGNTSICPLETGTLTASGASSYTWTGGFTGSSFTASPLANTLYTVVGSALSCTSTAGASITIKSVPVGTVTSNSPVCNGGALSLSALGGVQFSWNGPANFTSTAQNPLINGANMSSAGVYTVVVKAGNSCTAQATGTVVVNPTPTISTQGSTVCTTQAASLSAASFTGASYVWTGPGGYSSSQQNPVIPYPQVNNSGAYTVKVTSVYGCSNTAIANITVTALPLLTPGSDSPICEGKNLHLTSNNVPGGAYSWNGPNAFLSTLQNPGINTVTIPANGVYSLYVILGPCQAFNSTSVTINPLPTPTVISNSPVCETKSLALGALCPNITTYLWTGPNGYLENMQFAGRDSCHLIYSGIYTITVTDNKSCTSFATTSVVVLPRPTVSAVSSTVCYKDPAVLKASGATAYSWFGPSGLISNQTNAVITSATNTAAVIYTVIGAAINSCSTAATATLETLPLPVPAIKVYPSIRQCVNQEFTLVGSGANGYDWMGPANFITSGQTITFRPSTAGFSGTYTLVARDAHGCRANEYVNLTVDNLPGGSLGGLLQGCVPFCSDYKFFPSGISAPIKRNLWTIGNTTFNTDTFTTCFNVAGSYTISGRVEDINSCVNTSTYVINVFEQPNADFTFTPEHPVENSDEVVFENTSKGDKLKSWSWYFGDNYPIDVNKPHSTRYFDQAGTYPVVLVVKTEAGCLDTIIKLVNVDEDFNVFVPDVFSPNGDGINEIFMPVTRGIKLYTLQVFNRWGAKIFETTDRTVGWDGTFGGKQSPTDVYVWQITVSGNSGAQKLLKGHVTLYR